MNLSTHELAPGIRAFYRAGTSDEDALAEVIDRHAYRRLKADFDVRAGETWCDLGANIGSFALYCRLQGAMAVCFEPEPQCFKILKLNAPNFSCNRTAVTASKAEALPFYQSKNPTNHYRTTIMQVGKYEPHPDGCLPNLWAGCISKSQYDGIKMDVEGAEFGLIDNWLLPRANKLVFEYHLSRDPSWDNLANRLAILRQHFTSVWYPHILDDYIKTKGGKKPRYDQIVFCWNK